MSLPYELGYALVPFLTRMNALAALEYWERVGRIGGRKITIKLSKDYVQISDAVIVHIAGEVATVTSE